MNGRTLREIFISEAHSLLAHLGSVKTLSYLRDHVWWKMISEDVQKYCETCATCKRSKPNNQKPYGLLNSLEVPVDAWEAIGIDFVGLLPESSDRDGTYNAITTIIDLLTGMVHLVPSRINYKAGQVAELIFSEVYRLHGLPKRIISDRDVLFTSKFWQQLNRLIGVKTHLSSAYHPESDGATERANRTITQMIRNCISEDQKDWVQRLPAIEFAINISCSEATGFAPFFLNTGRMPRTLVWNSPGKNQYPGVTEFAERIKHSLMSAHDSIISARVKQTRNANRKRQLAKFEEGDLVYISTENMSIKKERACKLTPKYIGPYKILKDYQNNSFLIELPADLKKRGLHPTFHSSLLRIHIPNDDRLFPGRTATQIGIADVFNTEWKVDQIIQHSGRGVHAKFEILWPTGDRTWIDYETAKKLIALEDYFESLGIRDISELHNTDPASRDQLKLSTAYTYWGSDPLSVPSSKRKRVRRTRIESHKARLDSETERRLGDLIRDIVLEAEQIKEVEQRSVQPKALPSYKYSRSTKPHPRTTFRHRPCTKNLQKRKRCHTV